MEEASPKAVYDSVIALIESAIKTISSEKNNALSDESVKQEIDGAVGLLHSYKSEIVKTINELREFSEWDVFTISMFGETNAGKSTIVDTLRITLSEEGKKSTQGEFRRQAKLSKFSAEHFEGLRAGIHEVSARLLDEKSQNEILVQRQRQEQDDIRRTLDDLKGAIFQKKQALSLWQKILNLFRAMDEECQLGEHEKRLQLLQARHLSETHVFRTRLDDLASQKESKEKELQRINDSLSSLAPYEDGVIIGNGRSDFTLESKIYSFESESQKFAIIDVPGIEGKEDQVRDSISDSVKKAHAVFYITRKPSPPNKGESGKSGTLEKIREHLGSQTEVWAIYNKGVTNPVALQGAELTNDGEAASLLDLDKELKAQLGHAYQGCIKLSSLPAFYAVADCLLPTNSHYKNRLKFLHAMNASDLREKSGFDSFCRFIINDICKNYKEKIRKSNLRKIQVSIDDGAKLFERLIKSFVSAEKKLDKQFHSASSELDSLNESVSRKIISRCNEKMEQTKTALRQKIYIKIAADISNDAFKTALTRGIEAIQIDLVESLQKSLRDEIRDFEEITSEIVKRFSKNSEEILDLSINRHFGAHTDSFVLDFKMKNGIDAVGLISSLGGAVALIYAAFLSSNPVGWTVAAAIGAVTLIFSFYKSVRSFFSSDYKMEQQRKSADQNISKVFAKIEEALRERLSKAANEIEEKVLEIKQSLTTPLHEVKNSLDVLKATRKQLGSIAKNLA